MIWLREWLVLISLLFAHGPAPLADTPHDRAPGDRVGSCSGVIEQGGLLVCAGPPGTRFRHDEVTLRAGEDGQAIFGIARDAPARIVVDIITANDRIIPLTFSVAARDDAFRVIEGFDCDKVDARTPEQKAHAARSWVSKQEAFAKFHSGPGVAQGFAVPSSGPASSPFGPARKYVGISAQTGEPCEKVSVHLGYDIAAPVGTEIRAPAGGTVLLAEPDLYYEGGTVFLDHGHGLVSVFMHMSAVDVAVGDSVEAGERLGRTGNTGRTTGPHLHWAVKWRDLTSDDRSGDFYIDPALLLSLPRPGR